MTDGVKYYRGTYELPYQIGAKSGASSILALMDYQKTWLFNNGSSVQGWLGRFDQNSQTIYVKTDSLEAVGI